MAALNTPATHAPEGGRTLAAGEMALTRLVHAYAPGANTALIDGAYEVASDAHRAQTRDNGDPYITHPVAVAEILAGYHLDVASICTALLHDTVEDTAVTMRELEARFGPTIAGLVDGVTKLTRLELQSDRTKQAENFRKLVLAMSRDIRVLLVKLADRLHNMRTLGFVQKTERRHRIAHETLDIYAPLAARIGMDSLKTELQNRSFAVLEPEAHDTIQARLNYLRGQGADVIEEVRRELAAVCRDAGVDVREVSGREKSAFSIWQKMQTPQRGLRAAVRHHGVPHRGTHARAMLHGARRRAQRLSGDRRPLQGLHQHAEGERLPEPAHRRDTAPPAQPEDRSADPHAGNARHRR